MASSKVSPATASVKHRRDSRRKRGSIIGKRFGMLVVLEEPIGGHNRVAVVRCDCGVVKSTSVYGLTRAVKPVISCGCWARNRFSVENRQTTHGYSKTPTYVSWWSMLSRVRNPNIGEKFKYWGGRGIGVCERWLNFENFLADMGERPPGKTLDRYPDVDGDYEPGNVRWATPLEQARNQRPRTPRLTAASVSDKA